MELHKTIKECQPRKNILTVGEQMTLVALATGAGGGGGKGAARHLNKSLAAINARLKRVREKLEVKSTYEALAKAIYLELIDLGDPDEFS
ncbi:MAG: hypothetical protein COA62_11900 [Rhodobiaceae bacterium]|nr:MAG: hypothetical protein COA62_11900 [Rhodobiaceae bacterium]